MVSVVTPMAAANSSCKELSRLTYFHKSVPSNIPFFFSVTNLVVLMTLYSLGFNPHGVGTPMLIICCSNARRRYIRSSTGISIPSPPSMVPTSTHDFVPENLSNFWPNGWPTALVADCRNRATRLGGMLWGGRGGGTRERDKGRPIWGIGGGIGGRGGWVMRTRGIDTGSSAGDMSIEWGSSSVASLPKWKSAKQHNRDPSFVSNFLHDRNTVEIDTSALYITSRYNPQKRILSL